MPKGTKPAKETKAHWLSREVERLINPVLTAAVLGIGIFLYDHFTTDPEHQSTISRVEQAERTQALLAENVAVLTKSQKAASASIQSLSGDRAAGIEKGSLLELERLEQKNRGVPMDDWDVTDRRLYELAESQLEKAIVRSGAMP